MKQFSKPLVVVAEDEDASPAVNRAVSIALENGAPLTLLSVAAPIPQETAASLTPVTLAELQAALRERSEARLDALASPARDAGLSVRTLSREGTPFLVTIHEVLRRDHDLVLKATGVTGAGGQALSSTDKHLLRKCPCALWLLKGARPTHHRRILATVDPDPEQPEQVELSAAVLRAAVAVASMDAAQLHVLHAFHVFGESILRGSQTTISDPEVDHLLGNALNTHAQYVDDLVNAVSNRSLDLKRHLIRGTPGHVIASFVASNDVDLLVMGTVGRTGIAGFLIGNTAEQVTSEVDCSILALKPRGFVSPVVLVP